MQSEFTYKFINKTFKRYFFPLWLNAIFYTRKAFYAVLLFFLLRVPESKIGTKVHDIIPHPFWLVLQQSAPSPSCTGIGRKKHPRARLHVPGTRVQKSTVLCEIKRVTLI